MDEQKQSAPAHQPGANKGEEKPKSEGKESGRQDTGTTGQANRPSGKSTGKDSTSINPEKENPVDPQSPHMPTP
jgi:hypothetical protein